MELETVVLLFNGFALFFNAIYHFVRLYYERKKIKELERQTKLMEYYGPEA